MNTSSENAFYDLMSGDRINFRLIETREVEYDFKISPEIMNQFYQWKVDTLETTDIQPTELEMLKYFKNLNVMSSGPAGYGPEIEVVEIKIISVNEDK